MPYFAETSFKIMNPPSNNHNTNITMKTIHTLTSKTLFGALTLASILAISTSQTSTAAGVVLLDDFSTDTTVTPEGRVWESTLDAGWRGTTGYGGGDHSSPEHDSQWDISTGTLNNDANQTDSYVRGETPAYNWFTNPIVGDTRTKMTISFDYSTSGSDTLTAHFWAVQTGGTPTTTNSWITNNQGWINGNSGQNENVSNGGYDTFNLLDGDTTPDATDSITGQLSGTGTFTLTIDVSTLGIAGVSTVGDIDTFFLAFAGNETTGGTTWVDNLVITVPEPSSTALLGLGLSSLLLRRLRS